MIDKVITEMRNKPFTMLLMAGIYAGAVLSVSPLGFAWAGDMKQIQERVGDIQRSQLETQLRNVQAELFQLKQKVAELTSRGQPVDPLNYDRISTLESDQDALRRKLAALR